MSKRHLPAVLRLRTMAEDINVCESGNAVSISSFNQCKLSEIADCQQNK